LAVAFSPDSKLLASASNDETVRVWEVATAKEVLRLPGSSRRVRTIAFSPTDKILAAAGEGGTIALWDLGTGKLLHELKNEQALHTSPFLRTANGWQPATTAA
jgi:WD40 repeat protein